MSWSRRFLAHGVVWRRILRFGVINMPPWADPLVIGTWSFIFLLWRSGRRAVMHNLTAILPGSTALANLFRTYRVFCNFAWTIADNVRYKEYRVAADWEFEGIEHFEELQARAGGAIILTAHMGNYDLGAQLFAAISHRHIIMVRAPENDPETRRYEEELDQRTVDHRLKIEFNTRASDLALDLLGALQRGDIIAVQGDRVTPGISAMPATLFGERTLVPTGPFALAMAARVPIYPLFIIRIGRRRYRLVICDPIEVVRTRDRNEAFDRAAARWTRDLESVVARAWFQWFMFQPFFEERA